VDEDAVFPVLMSPAGYGIACLDVPELLHNESTRALKNDYAVHTDSFGRSQTPFLRWKYSG